MVENSFVAMHCGGGSGLDRDLLLNIEAMPSEPKDSAEPWVQPPPMHTEYFSPAGPALTDGQTQEAACDSCDSPGLF